MSKRRLLLVEDDAGRREAWTGLLHRIGCCSSVAAVPWDPGSWPKRLSSCACDLVLGAGQPTSVMRSGLRLLRERCPDAGITAVCSTPSLLLTRDLLVWGVHSVVLEGSLVNDLPLALQASRNACSFFSSALTRQFVEVGRSLLFPDVGAKLTLREKQVWEAVTAGQPTKEIARRLHVSAHTVEAHLRNLYLKLKCRGRREAALAFWSDLRTTTLT